MHARQAHGGPTPAPPPFSPTSRAARKAGQRPLPAKRYPIFTPTPHYWPHHTYTRPRLPPRPPSAPLAAVLPPPLAGRLVPTTAGAVALLTLLCHHPAALPDTLRPPSLLQHICGRTRRERHSPLCLALLSTRAPPLVLSAVCCPGDAAESLLSKNPRPPPSPKAPLRMLATT